MIGITYPGITTEDRALTDIITIDSNTDYDTIYLGSIENILLGFINQTGNYFEFVPQTQIDNPFPKRSSYQGCLADIFTLIANDVDLAIEFTVLTYRKANKEDK
jgi:hypothetical protein